MTPTRYEVDRLMSILRSRTVVDPGGNEEKRSEVKPVISHDKKKEFPKTPVRENGTELSFMGVSSVCWFCSVPVCSCLVPYVWH